MPKSYSPPMEMRLRVIDGAGGDKYGLNAYIYDSKRDWHHKYDRVLFSFTKDGNDKVANLREGQWADVKVTINGGTNFPTDPLNGKTGAMLIKVERLKGDLSKVRLFHTSVTRAIATWPNWEGEPGYPPGTFEDFVAEQFPSSQAGDFAVLEAGIVSEETYIEQGLYWETAYHPLIEYVLDKYQPDLALVGYPVTDEVQHQFLGLVTKKLPNGARQPGVRRRRGQRHARPSRQATRGVHPRCVRGVRRDHATRPEAHARPRPDDVRVVRPRFRGAVRGDRRQQGARRSRPAVEAADGELPPGDG